MNQLEAFLKMLDSADVHYEQSPISNGVRITVHSTEGKGDNKAESDWEFDQNGKLLTVEHYS